MDKAIEFPTGSRIERSKQSLGTIFDRAPILNRTDEEAAIVRAMEGGKRTYTPLAGTPHLDELRKNAGKLLKPGLPKSFRYGEE